MATYNRAHIIKETLNSILAQSYRYWELIIIDDGSTDNTYSVVFEYTQDNRITYIKRSTNYKKGLPGCRNQGLDLASKKYIIFFDDDDIVHPENLAVCVSELECSNSDFILYRREIFFNNSDDLKFDYQSDYKKEVLKGREIYSDMIMEKKPINSCAIMWSKKCFLNIRYTEDLMYAEEWECYSRILSSGFNGLSISKVLYYGRKHPHSNTGEFYSGDVVRVKSKIKAALYIIEDLTKKKLLTPNLIHYFMWLGVILKDKKIFKLLQSQRNVKYLTKIEIGFKYYFSSFIITFMRFKKRYLKKYLIDFKD